MLGIGMVLVIEGLVLALAPSRLEELLAALQQIGPEARRILGLLCIVLGLAVIWATMRLFASEGF